MTKWCVCVCVCACDKSDQSQTSAISATPATQSEGRCHQAPRLPRRMHVDVAKCHAKWTCMCHTCHATSRGDNGVHWEPSTPPEPAQCRKSCHACHAKCTSMSPSAAPATQTAAATTASTGVRHQSQPSAVSATPAKQNARRCRQVPRKQPQRQRHPLGTKHATRATPLRKCHACHAECTSMSPSATPATQSDGPCRQVQQRRPLGTKRATRASPVPHVPRLPRKVTVGKVFVSKLCV